MFLGGLIPGEQGPSAENPDTHLSRGSQVQGSSGKGCGGGGLQMWRGCSQVSEALWVRVGMGVGQGMCLWELQSEEQCSPAGNPDTHISRGSQA